MITAEASPNIRSILIVRLSAMGDIIHTLPAAQALRTAFPHAMIGWLIEERWSELLCAPGTTRRGVVSPARPLVDWAHTVNLREWKRSLLTIGTMQSVARAWTDVRSVHYDVAVDLQGAIRSAVLARWSGASIVWGSAEPRESPASLLYSRLAVSRGTHVVEQNLSLAETVSHGEFAMPRAELPRDAAIEQRVDGELRRAGVREFAILSPGAGWGAKCWPAERYGFVAKSLAADGVRSIINYGPGEERLASEAESASAGTATPLKCSLSELIALTRLAKLFIGGDTGPLHLAAALHVPVVAIFGPTNPARNGPYGTQSVVLRNPASPTTHARRAQPDDGLLAITTDAVATAARFLLGSRRTEQADV